MITHVLTYSSRAHPLLWGSLGLRHSAVWREGSDSLNTGKTQRDSHPEEEEFRVSLSGNVLHQTHLHSLALHHTTSSLGYTERSMHTGTGPQHRSEAGELLVLRWIYMQRITLLNTELSTLWIPLLIFWSHAITIPHRVSEGCSSSESQSKKQNRGEGRTERWGGEEITQYKCNCFSSPLPSVLSLGVDPVSTVNLYGPTAQQAPLTHNSLPEGPHCLCGNWGEERGWWSTENVEKIRGAGEGENWKSKSNEKWGKWWKDGKWWKKRVQKGWKTLMSLPPTIHSSVYEISSRAMSVHMSPPTSAWKVTLKGAGLDRMTLAYVHLLPWFPVAAHISRGEPLNPTV